MGRLRPYLQLVRLPNVFTAGADSLAGWLLAAGSLERPGIWVPLFLASMCIYAAGIALNDLFDVELDRRERPTRPLPSGAVSLAAAWLLTAVLLALGLILATSTGAPASLATALALVAFVVAYDARLRTTPLGPLAMGMCRALDVLLGMSPVPDFGGSSCVAVAFSVGLFVVGLTWISRSETHVGRSRGIVGGLMIQALSLALLATIALDPARFPPKSLPGGPRPIAGLLILLMISLRIFLAGVHAVRTPEPRAIQAVVKTGVLSLVWLHAAMVLAVRGPVAAIIVAGLWIPAFLLARRLYTT